MKQLQWNLAYALFPCLRPLLGENKCPLICRQVEAQTEIKRIVNTHSKLEWTETSKPYWDIPNPRWNYYVDLIHIHDKEDRSRRGKQRINLWNDFTSWINEYRGIEVKELGIVQKISDTVSDGFLLSLLLIYPSNRTTNHTGWLLDLRRERIVVEILRSLIRVVVIWLSDYSKIVQATSWTISLVATLNNAILRQNSFSAGICQNGLLSAKDHSKALIPGLNCIIRQRL